MYGHLYIYKIEAKQEYLLFLLDHRLLPIHFNIGSFASVLVINIQFNMSILFLIFTI